MPTSVSVCKWMTATDTRHICRSATSGVALASGRKKGHVFDEGYSQVTIYTVMEYNSRKCLLRRTYRSHDVCTVQEIR